ncbi:MAG: hypothetical protein ACPL1K_04035, partial [Candidatus Kryptoniota bacterium]
MQIKFGYYAEIRRMATGILQAVDAGLVGNDVIRSTTEEVMIKAPGYWLAPALVALASWMRNDKVTCDNALSECLKRDDYKATLFFMLLTQRLQREEASLVWLERYFIHQNPENLDREFLAVIEAVSAGVFHRSSRSILRKYVYNWLDQLTQGGGFVDEQRRQWQMYFEASRPPLEESKYSLLRQCARNWSDIENSLRYAKSNAILHDRFQSIISFDYDYTSSVKTRLDEVLKRLVTNFDDEELPLQEQVRLNQLIIEKEGDKEAALAAMEIEKNIFKEKVDFLQLLTNAAFNPEEAGVTKVTQVMALSISQPWIIEAFDSYVAQYRSKIPSVVELSIDGFTTQTKDGNDVDEQLLRQDR